MRNLFRSLSLLDGNGNLSITTATLGVSLCLAVYSVIANSPLGLFVFAIASLSAEHRRHLAKSRLSDQMKTVNESIKSLHLLVSEAQKTASIANSTASEAMRAATPVSLGQIGRRV